jgi:predicted  nucleic acid-binding Zn-ribbon protein
MDDNDAIKGIDIIIGYIDDLEAQIRTLTDEKDELVAENENLNEKITDLEMELEDIKARFEL